jgi:hypothetical protein
MAPAVQTWARRWRLELKKMIIKHASASASPSLHVA